MPAATAKSSRAAGLCELLLHQRPGCTWLLKPDLTFETAYGDAPRIFGRSAAQLKEVKFVELFAPPARAAWSRRVERVFAGERICAANRFTESVCACSITLFPITLAGQGVAYAGGAAHEMVARDLVLRTLRALDADRARMNRFLHDDLGQQLSAAGMQFDLLRMDLAGSSFPIAQRTSEIQAALESILESVRAFHSELNPALADRVGLRAALDRLGGQLRSNFKGNVRVLAGADAHPPPPSATALFRIAQEAAGYAARQPGCSAIEILLKASPGGVALEIRDNAAGFDMSDGNLQDRGIGILVMQYYADQAGIELQIESTPAKGTLVRALCRKDD